MSQKHSVLPLVTLATEPWSPVPSSMSSLPTCVPGDVQFLVDASKHLAWQSNCCRRSRRKSGRPANQQCPPSRHTRDRGAHGCACPRQEPCRRRCLCSACCEPPRNLSSLNPCQIYSSRQRWKPHPYRRSSRRLGQPVSLSVLPANQLPCINVETTGKKLLAGLVVQTHRIKTAVLRDAKHPEQCLLCRSTLRQPCTARLLL